MSAPWLSDEALRDRTVRLLRSQGYLVAEAERALDLLAQDPQAVAALTPRDEDEDPAPALAVAAAEAASGWALLLAARVRRAHAPLAGGCARRRKALRSRRGANGGAA